MAKDGASKRPSLKILMNDWYFWSLILCGAIVFLFALAWAAEFAGASCLEDFARLTLIQCLGLLVLVGGLLLRLCHPPKKSVGWIIIILVSSIALSEPVTKLAEILGPLTRSGDWSVLLTDIFVTSALLTAILLATAIKASVMSAEILKPFVSDNRELVSVGNLPTTALVQMVSAHGFNVNRDKIPDFKATLAGKKYTLKQICARATKIDIGSGADGTIDTGKWNWQTGFRNVLETLYRTEPGTDDLFGNTTMIDANFTLRRIHLMTGKGPDDEKITVSCGGRDIYNPEIMAQMLEIVIRQSLEQDLQSGTAPAVCHLSVTEEDALSDETLKKFAEKIDADKLTILWWKKPLHQLDRAEVENRLEHIGIIEKACSTKPLIQVDITSGQAIWSACATAWSLREEVFFSYNGAASWVDDNASYMRRCVTPYDLRQGTRSTPE